MKLLQLTLENFQGIPSLNIEPNGNNVSIFGDNATGKTTIANAISWLLYDKAYTGAKGYSPKTRGVDGEEVHYLHHAAYGVFKLEEGAIISLKRDLYESYKKIRGANKEEFTGHVIDHYIDGVPVKEKEYKARLAEICETEQTKMLTMPDYFAEQMTWQKRREILLEVCGNVTDQEVIAGTKELEPLTEYLKKPGTQDQYYTVEEYAAIAGSKKAQLNKELQSIPTRIDEAKKAMPDVTGFDEQTVNNIIKIADAEKSELEQNLANCETNQTAELRKQLADSKSEMQEARTEHNTEQNKVNEEINNEILKAQEQKYEIKETIRQKERQRDETADMLYNMEKRRTLLTDEYTNIKKEVYQGTTFECDDTCPTCGQAIPEDKIEEARKKHALAEQAKLEAFNLDKSNQLAEINKKGQTECNKDMIRELEEKLAAMTADIIKVNAEHEELENKIASIKMNIRNTVPFEIMKIAVQLQAKIDVIQKEIDTGIEGISAAKMELQAKINSKAEKIADLNKKKAEYALVQIQQNRITDLSNQEKQLAEEYEKIDYGINLCEEFTKAKVKMLTDNINQKFERVRFRLFKAQINGGITDDCEVLVPGADGLIPYSTANNAGRINAGLEIIKTLGEHWSVIMPVVVDNAESITSLLDIPAQTIRLVVSEGDKQLRVEISSSLKLTA